MAPMSREVNEQGLEVAGYWEVRSQPGLSLGWHCLLVEVMLQILDELDSGNHCVIVCYAEEGRGCMMC